MAKKTDIKKYIGQLAKYEIQFRDVPADIREDNIFLSELRKKGISYFFRRGFDVINNYFFVEEYIKYEEESKLIKYHTFENFDAYYDFLDGEIYDYSCYYQYVFSKKQIKDFNLNLKQLENTHFEDTTIDDWTIENLIDSDYDDLEKSKKQFVKWIDKFLNCKNSDDFISVMQKLKKSKFEYYPSLHIIADILTRVKPELGYKILIDICNLDLMFYANNLSLRYDTQKVLDDYNPSFSASRQTIYKRKRELKEFVNKMSGSYTVEYYKGFNESTHLFYVNKCYVFNKKKHDYFVDKNYFISFDAFTSFLNNDLSDCDLSGLKMDIDFSKYVINDKTILPFGNDKLNCIVSKSFDKYFEVSKEWYDQNGNLVEEKERSFKYFFDFVHFLNNDLSGMDFLLCDGIINLTDISSLNLKKCKFKSDFLEKFGLEYSAIELPKLKDYSFNFSTKNEEKTELVLSHKNELSISYEEELDFNKISYITDIHLMHRFANCKSENDREAILRKLSTLLNFSNSNFMLVGGDVSSEYYYYKKLLDYMDSENQNYRDEEDEEFENIIFILGNHELWNYPDKSFDSIVKIYKKELNKHKIYLLQNSIIYKQSDRQICEIDERTLSKLSAEELRIRLKKAQLIIFGGLGFSGLNEEYNANNGIYRNSLTRKQEIEESIKFEKLYKKVCSALFDKNVVIFTHTPKSDWTKEDYIENFVYVSGHTHENYFYDDGCTRIYSDNQIGYNAKTPFLKYFYIDKEYEYFADYKDGIYEISKDEYNDFYRAKNIGMDYKREGKIIMLKRNNYYCFFYEGKTSLSMLNGGALKSVPYDVQYYYDNMLKEIAFIKKPLDKYTKIQEKISKQIKSIGGRGTIHGAIIDIDFLNHIYVNPYDLSITGYYALDMIYKQAYPNIPALLKDKCPSLYTNYKKLLSGKEDNALVVGKQTELDAKPVFYFDTDIYRASREIRKMQKVNKGILSTWFDPETGIDLLE